MKCFSLGVFSLHLLYVANFFGQTTIKEDLKTLEQSAISAKPSAIAYTIDNLKSDNSFDFIGFNVCQSLDTLIVFVAQQKRIASATFEINIQPYLEKKLLEMNAQTFDFTVDEDLIYESFTGVLNYYNAISIVLLYEDYIVKNYKDQTLMANILTVLSYIKYAFFYLSKITQDAHSKYTADCFAADLETYNVLNWRVFAMHPGAILLFTIAACAWDYNFEK